jgi:nicotinamidase-related amidase
MQRQALLIIDVQNGLFPVENPVYNGDNLISNLKLLISKARVSHTPIFFIQHNEAVGEPLAYGTEGWKIHPDIEPTENDVIIHKTTPDSFFNTNLEEELKNRDIHQLILTGIQTDLCVDTTCRRAFSMGYEVTLVEDTHSTWDTNELSAQQIINHHNQVLRWFANTKNSSEIVF